LACSFPLPWHLAILPSKQLQPPSIPTPLLRSLIPGFVYSASAEMHSCGFDIAHNAMCPFPHPLPPSSFLLPPSKPLQPSHLCHTTHPCL
jgi:hypothetical protein